MQKLAAPVRTGRNGCPAPAQGAAPVALNEFELAARWRLSVHTLRRWRQEQLGPIFCKVGARVTYLISDIEAYERRVARHSTFARALSIRGGHERSHPLPRRSGRVVGQPTRRVAA